MATYEQLKAFAQEADKRGDREAAMAAMKKMQSMKQGTVADPIAQGLTLGFSDEIVGALGAIPGAIQTGDFSWGGIKDAYTGIRDQARANARGFRESNPVTSTVAEIGGGLLTGGAGAGRAAAAKGASLVARSAATGAGLGAVSGAGYSESDNASGVLSDAAKGGVLGGMTGAAFPAAGQALAKGKARVLAGRSTDPYKQAVGLLDDAKIPMTTAQRSGANWAKSAEQTLSEVPLGGKPLQTTFENQKRAFTRQLFKMIGVDDADMLTRENLEKAGQKLSREYTEALQGKGIDLADDKFLAALADIEAKHARFVDDPTKRKVRSIISEFLDEATTGPTKTGDWYQKQRSIFAKRAMRNSETSDLFDDLKRALDDAFAESAGKDVKGNLDARYAQYRQLRDMFDGVKGGAEGAEGFVPPGQLARLAGRKPGSQEWRDFTRAGATVLPDRMGNSGTAQRQFMLGLLGGGGVALDPTSIIYGPLAARAISGQLAKGHAFDVTRMMPGGLLLQDPRMIAPAANAGLLVSDRGRSSQ